MDARSPRLLLVVMCAGYFLVLLDVTVVNVALPRIAADLGAQVDGLQWVVDGYAIALASLMLAGGSAGDRYGHRGIVCAGLGAFGLASLGGCLAPSTAVLVAARVGQGVGAALMLPGTLAVITRAFPEPAARARAIGVWAAIGSTALPAGPVLGGAIVELVGWRAVFGVNVPITLVAGLLAARLVPASGRRAAAGPVGRAAVGPVTGAGAGRAGAGPVAEAGSEPADGVENVRTGSAPVDRAGPLLGAATLVATTFAVIEAGRAASPVVPLAAALVAVGCAVAFVAAERASPDPMLPLGLFGRRAFSVANACAGLMNLATLGLLFVVTLYLQQLRHYPPLRAGLTLLPLFLPLSLLAPLGGRVVARVGPRWPTAAGAACAALGVGLLVPAGTGRSYPLLAAALLLWGCGLAVLTPAVVSAAVGAVPGERAGLASAVNNTARQAFGAVGIAGFGALAGHGLATALPAAAGAAAGVFAVITVLAAAVLR